MMSPPTTHPDFGTALQALRERRGLSRKEFVRNIQPRPEKKPWRLDVLDKYEAGAVQPGLDVILRVCEAYGCTFSAGPGGMAFLDNQPRDGRKN